MNPVNKYATSLMDIILGSIGAFFFLLIILSASRRGIVQEGTQMVPNMMILKVEQPAELKIGQSIHYFVAQLKEAGSLEIENYFYSDVEIDKDIKNKLVDVNDLSLASPLILTEDAPPPIIVGIWLQDVLAPVRPEEFPKQPIKVNITCRKIYTKNLNEANPGFLIELTKENNYFAVYSLNEGEKLENSAELLYQGRPLIGIIGNGEIPRRSADEHRWESVPKPGNVATGSDTKDGNVSVNIDLLNDEAITFDQQHHYKDTGFLILKDKTVNDGKVIFRFVGKFNVPQDHRDPRDVISSFLEKSPDSLPKITYLAAGERAVCAVLDDDSLLFHCTDSLRLHSININTLPYPFTEYPGGRIPADTVRKITDKMRQVEPRLQEYDLEQLRQMLAEMIAAPNDRKQPYPVVRQNPLLWNLEK